VNAKPLKIAILAFVIGATLWNVLNAFGQPQVWPIIQPRDAYAQWLRLTLLTILIREIVILTIAGITWFRVGATTKSV
jgi:hypothetical protein